MCMSDCLSMVKISVHVCACLWRPDVDLGISLIAYHFIDVEYLASLASLAHPLVLVTTSHCLPSDGIIGEPPN